jgi:hypothetical protein
MAVFFQDPLVFLVGKVALWSASSSKGANEMKKELPLALAFTALVSFVAPVLALSESLSHPKILFPKGYDQKRAEQILNVLRCKNLTFRGGLISYWEPDWSTILVYGGDAKLLNRFLNELSSLPGVQVKISFAKDLSKESGTALPSGSWWVKYSHVAPDVLTVRVNLAAEGIDAAQLELWSAPVRKSDEPATFEQALEFTKDLKDNPSKPKGKPRPLIPVFKKNSDGWLFAATYKNTSTDEEDLPTLLKESSVVLDGKEHVRQGVRFGGRSNLHPDESWTFTIEMTNYLSQGETLSEGRHTLTLKFGGQEFGPVEFVRAPASK